MSHSIFGSGVARAIPRGTVESPPRGGTAQVRAGDSVPRGTEPPPTRTISLRAPAPSPTAPPACKADVALLAILDAPLALDETALAGFLRKEADLRTAFAALPVLEARALHARLSNPRAGDELAAKFARLTIERRTRLLTFLADARRREALALARR